MTDTRYISVTVYRATKGGANTVSNRFDTLYIAHPRGNFEEGDFEEDQLIWLAHKGGQPNVIPNEAGFHPNKSTMFGGNFVFSVDSRFRDISNQPLPVHDHME